MTIKIPTISYLYYKQVVRWLLSKIETENHFYSILGYYLRLKMLN